MTPLPTEKINDPASEYKVNTPTPPAAPAGYDEELPPLPGDDWMYGPPRVDSVPDKKEPLKSQAAVRPSPPPAAAGEPPVLESSALPEVPAVEKLPISYLVPSRELWRVVGGRRSRKTAHVNPGI